ncbi:hypothetical protein [Carnobacterium jeotgali]|uniref:hypothetical protein n=1 Tax=Carnobacterium jeotgali TaxID=545534 RepID=UPI000B0E6988|nr:hypothetical protein [Carnobacterium jeotgali]
MKLMSNGKHVENIAIEYNAGTSVSVLVKLTSEVENAYEFEQEELDKIISLTRFKVLED